MNEADSSPILGQAIVQDPAATPPEGGNQYRGFQRADGLSRRIREALQMVALEIPIPGERGVKEKWDRIVKRLKDKSIEDGNNEFTGLTSRALINMVTAQIKAFKEREQVSRGASGINEVLTLTDQLLETIAATQERGKAGKGYPTGRASDGYAAQLRALEHVGARARHQQQEDDMIMPDQGFGPDMLDGDHSDQEGGSDGGPAHHRDAIRRHLGLSRARQDSALTAAREVSEQTNTRLENIERILEDICMQNVAFSSRLESGFGLVAREQAVVQQQFMQIHQSLHSLYHPYSINNSQPYPSNRPSSIQRNKGRSSN
ncbi:MAG: hypothetical protein J3R72DRAFT_189615 [Linnemannia gamsii]|nr:MAG: hypothetical protein J3R72DRAFT_241258 [Linnemannia gamsii]KAK3847294.1 MAG: hypothetical protein J3R72DRAFT_189615 [Linnemannia gamsii]